MEEIEKLMGEYVAQIGSDDTTLAAAFYEVPASIVGPQAFLLLLTKTDVANFSTICCYRPGHWAMPDQRSNIWQPGCSIQKWHYAAP